MRLRRPDVPYPQTRDAYEAVDDHTVVPRRLDGLTYTWLEDDSDTPVLTVTVDVRFDRDGRRCSRIVIEEGTQQLTNKVLNLLDPDWLARDALAGYGFATSGPEGTIFTPDQPAAWAALEALPKRRSVNKSRLLEVAAAYKRGGVQAVERECNVSRSQAYRLIGQARGRDHLPLRDAE